MSRFAIIVLAAAVGVCQLRHERALRNELDWLANSIDDLSEATADAFAVRDRDIQRWGSKLVKDIEKAFKRGHA